MAIRYPKKFVYKVIFAWSAFKHYKRIKNTQKKKHDILPWPLHMSTSLEPGTKVIMS